MWSNGEVHFHFFVTVKKQIFRSWAAENPREIHTRPLHSLKVTLRCAVPFIGDIGPFFFENDLIAVFRTSNRYCYMLENFLRPKVENYEKEVEDF